MVKATLSATTAVTPVTTKLTNGVKLRQALEELGPIFVKFGQLLSTRSDILATEYIVELKKLQDQVPPFAGTIAQTIVETSLGKKINEIFVTFDLIPLAAASIAQVHAATLKDGSNVVVKILRPNIHQDVAYDLNLLETLAKIADKYLHWAKIIKVSDIITEFKHCLSCELDLMREAANGSQLRRNFLNSPLLYVPAIEWNLSTKNVLVMERVYGIPISNKEIFVKNNVNLKKLAEQLVEIFFTQLFRDCFFHADQHPGNIWVNIDNIERPQYLALDFGIVGTISERDQLYLAENALAFFNKDYRKVALLHIESGWIPKDTRIDAFESAIRTVCEPILDRPLKDISFGNTLMRLFQTAQQFNMKIQPQLILLQKTLAHIEGLGRDLYPELDLWNTAKPLVEQWMGKKIGINSIIKRLQHLQPQDQNVGSEFVLGILIFIAQLLYV